MSIAYLMLKNNEPYRYAKPKLMAEKFTALHLAAGGKASKSRVAPTLAEPVWANLTRPIVDGVRLCTWKAMLAHARFPTA